MDEAGTAAPVDNVAPARSFGGGPPEPVGDYTALASRVWYRRSTTCNRVHCTIARWSRRCCCTRSTSSHGRKQCSHTHGRCATTALAAEYTALTPVVVCSAPDPVADCIVVNTAPSWWTTRLLLHLFFGAVPILVWTSSLLLSRLVAPRQFPWWVLLTLGLLSF